MEGSYVGFVLCTNFVFSSNFKHFPHSDVRKIIESNLHIIFRESVRKV